MMKKVGIVTILDVANFGSILQAYALAIKIEQLGCDVEFINYWRANYTTSHKVKTFLADKSLGNIVKRIGFALSALCFYPFIRIRLRRFLFSRFSFTHAYYSIRDLQKEPPKADIYVAGSDQIWNSIYNNGIDEVFYLNFGDAVKIAYAASVGMDEFPVEEIVKVKTLLGSFQAISVREEQTGRYLQGLGFSGVKHVLDPTLLLTADEWKKVVNYKPLKHDPYLLVYSVERFNNDFIFSHARQIAKKRGLKMYVVCTTYPVKARDYGFDRVYAMADLKTFIQLMADADFVVVSSFHGTAFAINFNKEFVTISVDKFNVRIESLIRKFQISHRVIAKDEAQTSDLLSINYSAVNSILNAERIHSLNYLTKALAL